MNVSEILRGLPQDLKVFGTWQGWVGVERSVLGLDWLIGLWFLLHVVFGIFLYFKYRKSKDLIWKPYVNKWQNLFLWIGVSGLLWFLFKYQFVRLLGTRVVAALIVLTFVVLAARLLVYRKKTLPVLKKEYEARQQKLKYLTR